MEVAYPAAVLLFLTVLAALGGHAIVRGAVLPDRVRAARRIALAVALTGFALTVRALVGVLSTEVAAHETPGTTPLCLTTGVPALVYAFWLFRQAGDGGWRSRPELAGVERGGRYIAFAVVAMGLFWAANSLAGEVGIARAYDDARDFAKLPEVVLYTKDPLIDAPPETLHADFGKGAAYRHRYQNLRLLLASGGRLFLVPLTWKPNSRTARISTFVVPYDGNIRLQLIPQKTG
ncbi:hypothetical protein [Actinomadura rayongensis]|uniref:Uncharacterized protein n=1 Tax=Actinomadura rayongensis TaxID=1429076 RepID=A0A6I4W2N4_9ACTN|nr:hypothetical protein [Actinomadura rayongensis]MXQ64869.1 hypothetical protein [Actinomadura rayongensis]